MEKNTRETISWVLITLVLVIFTNILQSRKLTQLDRRVTAIEQKLGR